ncbi:MAG: RHS repeat-associated core domain-containing protein, partial [Chloroflexales bacterium]
RCRQAPPLISQTTYDALSRPLTATAPDGSVYQPGYNAANLLERVDIRLGGAATATPFVTNIDYDAKGQRVLIAYGNGATTGYDYDPLTFRLIGLQTTRPAAPDSTASLLFKSPSVVQDLRYTYDPVGNITRIEDAALRTTAQAGAACDYAYDALYRLTAASGREHSGQTDFALSPADGSRRDYPLVGQRIHPNDLQGLGGYVERYRYDAVGNMMELLHHAGGDIDQPGQMRWQRRYQYALDSNRLLATSLPGDPDGSFSAPYSYDVHGNMTSMPHLPLMRWDYRDQLCASSQQVVNNGTPETTYYVYDAVGQRVRKVSESQAGARKSERLYLGGYEIYREYGGGAVALERQTLHVMDDTRRIALVETQTIKDSSLMPHPSSLTRYQLGNHLGSASVEIDGGGALIGYEEYHPYGTSAFQAGRSAAEVSLKRYRYTGKERDDETGFSYHGARYYAPWLGRWASADPIGIGDGFNIYRYAHNRPIHFYDPTGTTTNTPDQNHIDKLNDEIKKAEGERSIAQNQWQKLGEKIRRQEDALKSLKDSVSKGVRDWFEKQRAIYSLQSDLEATRVQQENEIKKEHSLTDKIHALETELAMLEDPLLRGDRGADFDQRNEQEKANQTKGQPRIAVPLPTKPLVNVPPPNLDTKPLVNVPPPNLDTKPLVNVPPPNLDTKPLVRSNPSGLTPDQIKRLEQIDQPIVSDSRKLEDKVLKPLIIIGAVIWGAASIGFGGGMRLSPSPSTGGMPLFGPRPHDGA